MVNAASSTQDSAANLFEFNGGCKNSNDRSTTATVGKPDTKAEMSSKTGPDRAPPACFPPSARRISMIIRNGHFRVVFLGNGCSKICEL